jgi:3-hydroxyacyl-CoA dehydrogenase/enoyl-CoA hydratase/3-hydroxybutyryl-CoA epimerase
MPKAMPKALDELEAMDDLRGVYVRSGKPGQFFAGGDITAMMSSAGRAGEDVQ